MTHHPRPRLAAPLAGRGRHFALLALLLLIPPARADEPDPILTALRSSDRSQIKHALAALRREMESHPADTVDDLCQTYLPALMDARRYDDAASLAARGIQLCSSDADTLEILERYRVSAYLRSGRPRQALAAAKSLFNVATMPQTAPAILLVAECLNAANPGDPGPVERFKDQQVAGADPATRPSGPQPSVLAAIAPDSQPADDALRLFYHGGYVIHANQYRELVGRGNLLLLAGRADEARQVFIRALRIADADQLYAARENVARAIKADDGAIGRANAFLIRPDLDP